MGDAYAVAETSVWWDINSCPVPEGEEGASVESKIRSALKAAGYRGRVSIFAFGDFDRIHDDDALQALIDSGIEVRHIPYPGDPFYQLHPSMFIWADKQQGFPCNCLIASDDESYSTTMNHLKMKKVNVLLAHPLRTSYVLTDAANNAWFWHRFLAGKAPYKSNPAIASVDNLVDGSLGSHKGKQPTKEIPLVTDHDGESSNRPEVVNSETRSCN